MTKRTKGFKLDITAHSGVVVCKDCGWRSLCAGRESGWRLAASHERRAHPGQDIAADGLRAQIGRNAAPA